jgi:hypothetical protein
MKKHMNYFKLFSIPLVALLTIRATGNPMGTLRTWWIASCLSKRISVV